MKKIKENIHLQYLSKKVCISGPALFKLMCFEGQLYFMCVNLISLIKTTCIKNLLFRHCAGFLFMYCLIFPYTHCT